MRGIVRILVFALATLTIVLGVRAALLRSKQPRVAPVARVPLDEAALAERLAAGIRFQTISHQDGVGLDESAFAGLRAHLEASYPRVHETLTREVVGGHGLLYTWRGSDPSLPPIVLMAHQDVVPVEPGTEDRWEHPPFAGTIADGYVYGRGALDDKGNLFGQLEAVESLLAEGVTPRRSVLLVFGHDEEIGGEKGAVAIAKLLEERGVRPLVVLDEGGSIVEGLVPGVDAPVAAIGVAEKGYVSVDLSVEMPGGHSSTPPRETSIGVLAAAIGRLERHPPESRLEGPTRQMLEEGVGPEARFPYRLVLANLWLFAPLVELAMEQVPAAAATIRTSTAATIFDAGVKENVIPSRASAVVNFRILPGDTIESVVDHVRRTIDDPRVEVTARPRNREPSPPSKTTGEGWELLTRSIREIWPEAIVTPYLMIAGTDSRHFRDLSDSVYRFMPLRFELDDTRRIHGTNERIPVAGYADLVRAYRRLLENAVR